MATSALSMGFDKPDLGFVVHLRRPRRPYGLLPKREPLGAIDAYRQLSSLEDIWGQGFLEGLTVVLLVPRQRDIEVAGGPLVNKYSKFATPPVRVGLYQHAGDVAR